LASRKAIRFGCTAYPLIIIS